MSEYRFEHPPAVAPGRVVFHVDNRGSVDHQLVLVRLPGDLLSLDAEIRSPTPRPVETLRLLPSVSPGASTAFAADLQPGRYGLLCFLPGADGQTHARQGMNSELRAG